MEWIVVAMLLLWMVVEAVFLWRKEGPRPPKKPKQKK
jgi:hypothetical protein